MRNNIVLKSAIISASHHTHLYDKLMAKTADVHNRDDVPLNSRSIRHAIYQTYRNMFIIPSMIDNILKYVFENRDSISGETAAKVLHCLYKMGYDPQLESNATEKFNFEALADIIHREFDLISGPIIVKSCLALCYFRVLPHSLIDRIFHVDFITRLENEIITFHTKASYRNDDESIESLHHLTIMVCLCSTGPLSNDYSEYNHAAESGRLLRISRGEGTLVPTKLR